MRRLIILGLAAICLFLIFIPRNKNSVGTKSSPSPAPSGSLLGNSWNEYKKKYISTDGRVIDFSRNNITTSEGQSYALLRAVWMDDRATFDKVWKFTRESMKRANDNLIVWKWGEKLNGSYGFLDENSASDGDSDVALALILAGNRWKDQTYTDSAKLILKDLWTLNTAVVQGRRYLTAGNWANGTSEVVLNPSYFAPYAWRMFAKVDSERNWMSLIDPAYMILTDATVSDLDIKSAGLPPDWVAMDPRSGTLKAASNKDLSTKYSYDALRVPWRIALDYQWNKEQKAFDYLQKMSFFTNEYLKNGGRIFGEYAHSGELLGKYESPSMYAGTLGYFMVQDPEIAKRIYIEKIAGQYSNNGIAFKEDLGYYEQNWLWFGAALYSKSLVKYE